MHVYIQYFIFYIFSVVLLILLMVTYIVRWLCDSHVKKLRNFDDSVLNYII